MMNVIIEDAKFEDLNLANYNQRAYSAFLQFWNGEENEFFSYFDKHKIDTSFQFENLEQAMKGTDKFLANFSEAIKNDIGKFDFRLSTALTQKNIKPLEESDFVKITLINDDINTKEIYDTFLSFHSRSFMDFRFFDETNNTLTFIYNRRGIFDESGRIAVVKSRKSATLSDNFKLAKDNNFILSGLCKEFAKENKIGFKFEYIGAGDVVKQYSLSADEILTAVAQKEEIKEQIKAEIVIKQEAREEVKQEAAKTRLSLSPDSNENEILKEGNSEIRFQNVDIKDTKLDSLEDVIKNGIEKYRKKEQEKLAIRLEKAERQAFSSYKSIRNNIANGMTIVEAINLARQEAREEHTINLAGAFLTKDILEVEVYRNQAKKAEEKTIELSDIIEEKNKEITKREETISSLRSTLTTKSNELNILQEKHKDELNLLINETKKTIENVKQTLEKDLITQDELITRLSAQVDLLKENLEKKNIDYEKIIRINEQNNVNLNKAQQNIENLELENSKNKAEILALHKEVHEYKNKLFSSEKHNKNLDKIAETKENIN
ncbi:hypothetical protein A9K75_09230, partial [Campylobacter fetus subsp. testudinum]|uniref:hypothetical protein n=1 Tax=Campylobacter fetus TaxID=196 RepID=UPI000818C925